LYAGGAGDGRVARALSSLFDSFSPSKPVDEPLWKEVLLVLGMGEWERSGTLVYARLPQDAEEVDVEAQFMSSAIA
jgi:hypothetical protein